MRRTRFILALIGALSVVTSGARPAPAHFCSFPVEVNVGETVTVNIGVAAEMEPVRDVEIEIPDGFAFEESFGYMGYVGTRQGKWVHFTGAEIQPNTCHYFALQGEATRKGRLVARIITTTAGGTRTRYEDVKLSSLTPAMQIFAGVKIADYADDGGGSGGLPAAGIVGIGLAVVALGSGVALFVRRRVTMKG